MKKVLWFTLGSLIFPTMMGFIYFLERVATVEARGLIILLMFVIISGLIGYIVMQENT